MIEQAQAKVYLGGRDPNTLSLTERERALTTLLM
jgi:hypothetical protein